MQTRKASIKETGEELSPADWERFDAAAAQLKAERQSGDAADTSTEEPDRGSIAQAVARTSHVELHTEDEGSSAAPTASSTS